MNNSFSHLNLQKKRLPWCTFLFLLGVFVFTTPYDFSYSVKEVGLNEVRDVYEAAELVEEGNIGRRVALFSLGAFATISLLRRKRNRFRINGLLGWLILFFLLLALLSITWAIDTSLTVRRVAILFFLSLGALAVAERLQLGEIVTLFFFLCGITLLTAIIAELAANTFQPFNASWRFAGLMHAGQQAWNCSLLAIASFSLCRLHTQRRAVLFVVSLVALLFLVLTRSRMGFVAGFVGLSVYWGLVLPKSHKVLFVFVFSLIICFSLLYTLLGGELIANGVKGAASFGRGEEGKASIGTLTGRIPLWKECLRYAAKRPLLGYGYNAFFSPRHQIQISQTLGWVPGSAHSGYIDTLLGLGFAGGGTLVLILLISLKASIILSERNPEYAFVVAVLVWLCFNLVVETNLITLPIIPTFIFMILMAKLGFLQTPLLYIKRR